MIYPLQDNDVFQFDYLWLTIGTRFVISYYGFLIWNWLVITRDKHHNHWRGDDYSFYAQIDEKFWSF